MELTKDLSRILNIGISLMNETDYHRLMDRLLLASMEITNCDAGCVYAATQDGLRAIVLKNNTTGFYKGAQGDRIPLLLLPYDKNTACIQSAKSKVVCNIPDIYQCPQFTYHQELTEDAITSYHTKSVLTIPLFSHEDETLGVLKLSNAKAEDGTLIPFDSKYEPVLCSLAAQASATLANMKHLEEMKLLLHSLVRVFTTAIDERSPYNTNHTMKVANYAELLMEFSNELHEKGEDTEWYSDERKEEVIMAALVHDIGKLTTPTGVMNKSTRLGHQGLEPILRRFELIEAKLTIDWLENKLTREEYQDRVAELEEAEILIKDANKASFLEDVDIQRIDTLGKCVYYERNGNKIEYLTASERQNLSIRKGTLSAFERSIMQNHVIMTSKMLDQIHFGKSYQNVPKLASAHHEFLDGSGYPNHLRGEDMPRDARILVVMDIFDSLISMDRPYKDPMAMEEALGLLSNMAEQGKIDTDIVHLLIRAVEDGKLF